MIFPVGYCLPTTLLTRDSYSLLICKLVTDGYVNMISHKTYDIVILWDYIGVSWGNGDIQTYTHPHSFMEINAYMDYRGVKDEDYPNVITREQLERYLK